MCVGGMRVGVGVGDTTVETSVGASVVANIWEFVDVSEPGEAEPLKPEKTRISPPGADDCVPKGIDEVDSVEAASVTLGGGNVAVALGARVFVGLSVFVAKKLARISSGGCEFPALTLVTSTSVGVSKVRVAVTGTPRAPPSDKFSAETN